MKTYQGSVWQDNKGIAWVDPYKEEVWEYNLQIAKEAAGLGFDEVQFDYVRFPENSKGSMLKSNSIIQASGQKHRLSNLFSVRLRNA